MLANIIKILEYSISPDEVELWNEFFSSNVSLNWHLLLNLIVF